MERVRRVARGLLGYKSPLYRAASQALNCWQILRREGWKTTRSLTRLENSAGPATTLRLRSLRHPFIVRPGTVDVATVIDNVVREEWGQFPAEFIPSTIIDAGAYIGDTAAYLLTKFPSARLIAIEPNDESYMLAAQNLAPYGKRVSLVLAALWSKQTVVRLSGVHTGAAIDVHGQEVATETIPSLMSKFAISSIDLLKLDIEGAEIDVLEAGAQEGWLNKIRVIVLEIHSYESERPLIGLLSSAGFQCTRFRNAWYCVRREGSIALG